MTLCFAYLLTTDMALVSIEVVTIGFGEGRGEDIDRFCIPNPGIYPCEGLLLNKLLPCMLKTTTSDSG